MSDLIDRQAVIDLLKQMRKDWDMVPWEGKDVFARIRKLPTIQPEKAQLSSEGTTSDLIDRQQAIDGLDGHYIERRNLNDWQAGWNAALDWMGSTYLDEFPSAQFDKDIDVPSNDTISRQAAIDAFDCINGTEEVLRSLPSIQPEQCGDKSYTLWKESYEELKRRMDELTSCSDIISRQAAIDAAKDWYEGLICGSINGLIKRLNALPTIQPEPHEGHWIDKGWNGDWGWQIDGRGNCWRVIECSECGKSVLVESNYCPHCGARMKGSEHEID